MANKVTLEPLMENMRVKLQAFNNEGVEIANETIHNDVLADDKFHINLYKGAIMWVIWANGGKKTNFPSGWLNQTVQELAEFIISKQPAE